MRQEFAVRFKPNSGATNVAVDQYLRALGAIVDAIVAVRSALASIVAEKHGWPVQQVRRALEFSVGPTKRGSLIVPLIPGATPSGAALGSDAIASVFWRDMSEQIAEVKGRRASHLSANAADALARASAAAREANAGLSLVARKGRHWRATANLSRQETALRAHAERRRTGHEATVALTGRIASLTFDPPSFVLDASDGKRTVRMPASLRDDAHKNWGGDVVVDVIGKLSFEGEIAEARAVAIRTAVSADAALAAFDKTFGSLRDVFGTPEAKEYLRALRSKH